MSVLAGVRLVGCWLALGLVLASGAWAAEGPPSDQRPQEIPRVLDRIYATANDELDIDGLDDNRVDVDVAVLDTGIKLDHPDLNVFERTDCTDATWPLNGQDPDFECTDSSPDDGDDDAAGTWHGSTAAANIAALDNNIGKVGVAAGARLWSVDVSGEERYGPPPLPDPLGPEVSFDLAQVIAGVKWVTAHADEIEVAHIAVACIPDVDRVGLDPAPPCLEPENVDLVAELEDALAESMAAGVVYVFAAGALYETDLFVPQRFDDMLTSSQVLDTDGKPGGLGPDDCGGSHDDESTETHGAFLGSSWGADIDIASVGCAGSQASALVSGAAAILASQDNPDTISDVRQIAADIAAAGNQGWTDNSPDGVQEPLLDLSDPDVFDPEMTAGTTTNGGWSHDLQVRCAKSVGPTGAFYYSDTTQCQADGRNWSVFVPTLNSNGACPGPQSAQSFAINQAGSPPTLNWYQYWGSDLGPNWTANMKVDNVYTSMQCVDSDTVTWLGLGKNVDLGGGPLPHPTRLRSSHQMAYGEWRPNGGSTRLVAGAVLRWNNTIHRIEINLHAANTPDNHAAPEVVEIDTSTPGLERLVLDGPQLGYGVPSDYTPTTPQIDWSQLLAEAIDNEWLTPPTTGLETLGVYIATETTGHTLSNLWTTSFRVQGTEQD